MTRHTSLNELEAFARQRIAAERYPDARHVFRPYACDACGLAPFALTIQHHTGSRRGDFKGVIWGECTVCGHRKRLFSFTGDARKPLREEQPACSCGNEGFYVAECERFEGDEGLTGFFDEGTVVGQCSFCGQHRALVDTD